jgi:glycosyltransferase involved in cell wall biosynthesis
LAASRLAWTKGNDVLLDAISIASTRDDSVRLVLAGDGPEKARLQRQADRLGIQGIVSLIGHVASVEPLFANAAVFAAPSIQEGLGYSALEAMRAGVPVVASRVGGLPEAVGTDGRAGVLVPAGIAPVLAEALLRLWSDPVLCTTCGEHGRARIAAHFSIDSMMTSTERALTRGAA